MVHKIHAGIKPDCEHTIEQPDATEQERKSVRDALISAYDKNISTRLKVELCSLDVNTYNFTKEASTSKPTFFSLSSSNQINKSIKYSKYLKAVPRALQNPKWN